MTSKAAHDLLRRAGKAGKAGLAPGRATRRQEYSASTKRALVATISLALEVHAQLEEEIFYPAMGSVDTALVGRLIPEHDRRRTLIGQLRNGDAADPQYDQHAMELMRDEPSLHHLSEELVRRSDDGGSA